MPESSVVVNLKAFGEARRGMSATSLGLLHASRDRLAEGMVEILARNVKRIESTLFNMADRAPLLETRNACFAGQALLRDQPGALSAACRAALMDAFDEALAAQTGGQGGTGKSDGMAELSLIGDADYEVALAQDKAASRWRFACAESLVSLDARMAHLLGRTDMSENDNPLGPKILCRAVFGALGKLLPAPAAQVVMLAQCERVLGDELPEVYSAINRLLIDQGILPDLKLGSQSQPAKAARSQPGNVSGDGDLVDIFEALAQQGGGFGGARNGLGGSGAGAPQRLFDVLGNADGGGMTLPGGDFFSFSPREGVAVENILRRLQASPAMQSANPLDAMMVDAIAMLFDMVFESGQATDGLRAQIGRLQIPVLRVALQDRSLFSKSTHPVRRVLDALTRLAPRLPDTEQGTIRLATVSRVLDAVVDKKDTDSDVFDSAAAALEAIEADYDQALEASIAPEIGALLKDERAELAPVVANDAISRAVDPQTTPALIIDFLRQDWSIVLVNTYLDGGEQGAAYRAGVETLRELVWSVAPKADMDARLSLVRVLPGLLRRLREGCTSAHVVPQRSEHFFAGLVALHAQAVRPGSEAPTGASVEPLRVVAATQPANDAAVDADEPAPPSAAAATPAAEAPALIDDEYSQQARALDAGDWVEFHYESGNPRCARLGWISRVRNTYLFSDQDGLDSFSISLARLADKLRTGEAVVLPRVSITETAFEKLMKKIKAKLANG
jgi:hypothetical protein